jgi:hypothetical protein
LPTSSSAGEHHWPWGPACRCAECYQRGAVVQGQLENRVEAAERQLEVREQGEGGGKARVQQLQEELAAAAAANTELQQRNVAVEEGYRRQLEARSAELAASVRDSTALQCTVRRHSCQQGCMTGRSRRVCQPSSVNSQQAACNRQQSYQCWLHCLVSSQVAG